MNIKKYFSVIIIFVLVVIILLQRSCKGNSIIKKPTIETRIDTIWKFKHDTVVNNVKEIKVIHVTIPSDPQFHPSNDIDTCKNRFNNLLTEYLTKHVYTDTIKLDSLGTITIFDTVFKNKLGKRTKIYNYKIPFVTKTVTKLSESTRQLYIGGNLFGDKKQLQLFSPGLLYKTKQDHIYQANIGINFDGVITYGLGAYWKIKLK